jgi:hypothetical protein
MSFNSTLLKKFINRWNNMFFGHPWLEASSLSILFHIILISFIWLCCQLHVMFVPHEPRTKIIEIEFVDHELLERKL